MMGFVSGKTLPRNLHVLFTVFGVNSFERRACLGRCA